MAEKNTSIIQTIKSEVDDDYSDDALFNISSWGADLSFRELVTMYEEGELAKPEMQRKYVWDKYEASRFIESILMGLPVPNIFLAQAGTQKLIVDGYQRIMTVYDYIRGIFTTDGKVFKLSNSDKINSRWRNSAFSELSKDEQRKIKSTTIHAIIFEQKKPENDDTSLFQVFERINTSGRTLTPQEIRNCVYQGSFNSLLFELNDLPEWRYLFGQEIADSRMRDIECILRFFLIKSDQVQKSQTKQISLKKSLNEFMNEYKDASDNTIEIFRSEFTSTINEVKRVLGKYAFRNYTSGSFSKKFHPAIYDAVSVAFFYAQSDRCIPIIAEEQFISLLQNSDFIKATKTRTTDVDNIRLRVKLVHDLIKEAAE